ncbi:MAG: ABC transporter ATP-binding protein [Halobacteriovoraceae bacterium]|jgi:iron complex transport system ATP-binding protein|nr:ABC transporter ATP-binding protein [Halobacteriovoraceae bacterium]
MSAASLTTKKLNIGYGKKEILADINFELFPGEVIGVLGKNGTGKSTLLKTLCGLLPSLGGSVELLGNPISSFSRREMAQKVSVVLTGGLPASSLSVEEVFRLGRYPYTNYWGELKEDDLAIIHEAMEIVGLLPFRNANFFELSDGQKQKTLIGRALAQDTPVLILDEPTSFLDIPSKMEIVKLLKIIAKEKGKAVLFSCHDWELVLSMLPLSLLISNNELYLSSPEDLVMNGKMASSFLSEQFRFDIADARFKEKNYHDKKIFLEIEDPDTLKWAGHFLSKLNYQVVDNHLSAEAKVSFRSGIWCLNGNVNYENLGMLLRAL